MRNSDRLSSLSRKPFTQEVYTVFAPRGINFEGGSGQRVLGTSQQGQGILNHLAKYEPQFNNFERQGHLSRWRYGKYGWIHEHQLAIARKTTKFMLRNNVNNNVCQEHLGDRCAFLAVTFTLRLTSFAFANCSPNTPLCNVFSPIIYCRISIKFWHDFNNHPWCRHDYDKYLKTCGEWIRSVGLIVVFSTHRLTSGHFMATWQGVSPTSLLFLSLG